MSLTSWRIDGKMSLKMDKTVPNLVEKYKREFPNVERDLLRRLIRVENPKLFLNNPSNLKKLDRYLRKAFAEKTNKQPLSKEPTDLIEKTLLKLAEDKNRTTMQEVASEVGLPASYIELSVYQLVKKHGWKTAKITNDEIEIDFRKPVDIHDVFPSSFFK